jgi:hypothetical protein
MIEAIKTTQKLKIERAEQKNDYNILVSNRTLQRSMERNSLA